MPAHQPHRPRLRPTDHTYHHVNVETWADGYRSELDLIQAQYASMAPVNLGSMGYVGRGGGFVPRDVLSQALQDGTALGFYCLPRLERVP